MYASVCVFLFRFVLRVPRMQCSIINNNTTTTPTSPHSSTNNNNDSCTTIPSTCPPPTSSPTRKTYPTLMLTKPNTFIHSDHSTTTANPNHTAPTIGSIAANTNSTSLGSSPGSPYSPLSAAGVGFEIPLSASSSAGSAVPTKPLLLLSSSSSSSLMTGSRSRKSKLISDIACVPEGVPLDMTTLPRGRPPPSPLNLNSRQVSSEVRTGNILILISHSKPHLSRFHIQTAATPISLITNRRHCPAAGISTGRRRCRAAANRCCPAGMRPHRTVRHSSLSFLAGNMVCGIVRSVLDQNGKSLIQIPDRFG